jgi:hypothetical protein
MYLSENDIFERLEEIARSQGMSRTDLVYKAELMQLRGDVETEVMGLLFRLDEIRLDDATDPWLDVD